MFQPGGAQMLRATFRLRPGVPSGISGLMSSGATVAAASPTISSNEPSANIAPAAHRIASNGGKPKPSLERRIHEHIRRLIEGGQFFIRNKARTMDAVMEKGIAPDRGMDHFRAMPVRCPPGLAARKDLVSALNRLNA